MYNEIDLWWALNESISVQCCSSWNASAKRMRSGTRRMTCSCQPWFHPISNQTMRPKNAIPVLGSETNVDIAKDEVHESFLTPKERSTGNHCGALPDTTILITILIVAVHNASLTRIRKAAIDLSIYSFVRPSPFLSNDRARVVVPLRLAPCRGLEFYTHDKGNHHWRIIPRHVNNTQSRSIITIIKSFTLLLHLTLKAIQTKT